MPDQTENASERPAQPGGTASLGETVRALIDGINAGSAEMSKELRKILRGSGLIGPEFPASERPNAGQESAREPDWMAVAEHNRILAHEVGEIAKANAARAASWWEAAKHYCSMWLIASGAEEDWRARADAAEAKLAEEQAASASLYASVFRALGIDITDRAGWAGLPAAAERIRRERDAALWLNAELDWINDGVVGDDNATREYLATVGTLKPPYPADTVEFAHNVVKKLTAERDEARAELDQVQARVAKALALHDPERGGQADPDGRCFECGEEMPCPTRIALAEPVTDREEPARVKATSVEFDREAGAAYVQVLDEAVHHTTEETVNVDRSEDGTVIGIELLDAADPLKLECPDYHCAHSYEQTGREDVPAVHHRLWDHLVTQHGAKCVGGIVHKVSEEPAGETKTREEVNWCRIAYDLARVLGARQLAELNAIESRGADSETKPRTLLGWTVPPHVKFEIETSTICLACTWEHGPWDVSTLQTFVGDKRVERFLRSHAHGQPVERQADSEPEQHLIEIREDGWTIQHPLACRPNLFDCPVNRAAGRDLREPPAELGRFVCGLADDGSFVIGSGQADSEAQR